jgi:acetolactate synthase small subunit
VKPPSSAFTSSTPVATNARSRRFPPFYDPNSPALRAKTAEEAVNNIVYNTPVISQNLSRRILSCLVTNEPGVLSRISGILAARSFNIDSLVVAATNVPDLSRMTIVVRGQESIVEQARRQLEDLVPVWAVLDYSEVRIIEREMLLIKVSLLPQDRPAPEEDKDDVSSTCFVSDGCLHEALFLTFVYFPFLSFLICSFFKRIQETITCAIDAAAFVHVPLYSSVLASLRH